MTINRSSLLVGVLLLAAGFLLLLGNLGVFGALGDTVWGLLFLVGGVGFLLLYFSNRSEWWPIIPGFVLLGLGAIALLSQMGLEGDWLGSLLFLAIGAAFVVVYVSRPTHNWWAIIPAGVMASLALTVITRGDMSGAIFMLGLAGTFLLVYVHGLLVEPGHSFGWALIPAAVMGVIGLFVLADAVAGLAWIGQLWPLILILIGVGLLLRAAFNRQELR